MNCILLCVQQCPVSLHNYNHSSLSHGQTTYSVKTFIEFSHNSTKIRRERTIVKNSGWLLLCWCLWEILSVPYPFVCFWLFLEYFRGKLMLFAFLILLLDTKTVLLIYPRDINSREKNQLIFSYGSFSSCSFILTHATYFCISCNSSNPSFSGSIISCLQRSVSGMKKEMMLH